MRRNYTLARRATLVVWMLTTHWIELLELRTWLVLWIQTEEYWIDYRALRVITAQNNRPVILCVDRNYPRDFLKTVRLSKETLISCTLYVLKMRFPHHPAQKARLDWDQLTVACWLEPKERIARELYPVINRLDRVSHNPVIVHSVLLKAHGEWSPDQLTPRTIPTSMMKQCNLPRSSAMEMSW